ncbi:MAG: hypothetical protein EOP94_00285 [Zymomonas sp.]|nr:MAG: hypothetical protein EOP94_00285 [Zymomonas sp.]
MSNKFGTTTCAELGFAAKVHIWHATFVTRPVRLLSKTGSSLRDAQERAGRRLLNISERDIQAPARCDASPAPDLTHHRSMIRSPSRLVLI